MVVGLEGLVGRTVSSGESKFRVLVVTYEEGRVELIVVNLLDRSVHRLDLESVSIPIS